MEERRLELNLISAKDLKNVNIFTKMDVYAVVSLGGNKKTKTHVDRNGGRNPTWNFPMQLTIDETLARQNRLILEIKLRCERALTADKEIGQVHVPLADLLRQTPDGKSFHHVSYQVTKPSGKPKGTFNFSYKIISQGFSSPSPAPPPSAPPPPVSYASPYPPPPPPQHGFEYGYGYPPPPQQGYGYGYPAQAQQGYGYGPYGQAYPAQAQQGTQRAGKNNFGMGLGAGLLGGALGGLLVGDIISDAF